MKRLFFIAISLTSLFILSCFLFPKPFESLEVKWVDQFFKFRGEIPPQNSIVLVTIDEKSLTKLGRWPWPRSQIARLIQKLSSLGVREIGFDITFSEKSLEDGFLAQALKNSSNTILGYFFYLTPEETSEADLKEQEIKENDQSIFSSRLSLSSKQLETSGEKVYGVQANVVQISKALPNNRQGFFNIFPDRDGVIRQVPLALFYKGYAYPSLALQLASLTSDFSPVPLFNEEGLLKGLGLGTKKIPLSQKGEFFINYRGGPKTFFNFSIADVLEDKIPKEQLEGKIALVGATAVGIYDMRVVPTSPNFPGVEIQANILDNLLTGDFLISNSITKFVSFALILFGGIFLGISIPRLRAFNSFLVFMVFISLILAGGIIAFLKYGLILHTVKGSLNSFLVYGGLTIYRYFTEEKERRKIKKTFEHYLSPQVIQVLLEHPEQLKLGGERKVLTVLFSDIRDFTPKSERLPPEKVVQLLNDYFTAMTEIIFKYEGTVDKFMGDAIMAIFGAPLPQEDHAQRACFTALEMIQALEGHKKEWCQKYGLDDFKIGIGIHTGEMAIGNMGSLKRFNYTAIGDSVNLASRLETLTKEYNVPIIISEMHYQMVKEKVMVKELGEVKVKGKQESTRIFELTGRK